MECPYKIMETCVCVCLYFDVGMKTLQMFLCVIWWVEVVPQLKGSS